MESRLSLIVASNCLKTKCTTLYYIKLALRFPPAAAAAAKR
jgi:hypothetical protein